MIRRVEAVVKCDWPGCDHEIKATSGEYFLYHRDTFEEWLSKQGSKWIFRFKDVRGGVSFREDFCPDHGRCSWCKERMPRKRLTAGIGECEGQLICTTCIIEREA